MITGAAFSKLHLYHMQQSRKQTLAAQGCDKLWSRSVKNWLFPSCLCISDGYIIFSMLKSQYSYC